MDVSVNAEWREVTADGKVTLLTPTEWRLFIYLFERGGWHSVKELASMALEDASLHRSVRWYVKSLRRKLGRECILTRRTFGYAYNREH